MRGETGMTLIELMIGLMLGSLIILSAFSIYIAVLWSFCSQKSDWVCMQALRTSVMQLDRDLMQCALLLPQDMRVSFSDDSLFIAGVPSTSESDGLEPNKKISPPYYSLASSKSSSSILLDDVDIDGNGTPDYTAGRGIITDKGAYKIKSNYSKGNSLIPLKNGAPDEGERVVPAVVYDLRKEGLYRNGQLLSENISDFTANITGNSLKIRLEAARNGTTKEISYDYYLGQ